MHNDLLNVSNLEVKIEDKTLLNGLNLTIKRGEIHAVMGPNGSGKSTLCNTIMGHPKYQISNGEISINQTVLNSLTPDLRAKQGLFLGFQYPQEVNGITMGNFLRQAVNKMSGEKYSLVQYHKIATELLERMKLDKRFVGRGVNEGFSGGEKKRAEMAQMLALKPKFALLDEIDSGLDIDGLKQVADGINQAILNFQPGILLITHYQRLLHHVRADRVHVMVAGRIVESGGMEIVEKLEKNGYQKYLN